MHDVNDVQHSTDASATMLDETDVSGRSAAQPVYDEISLFRLLSAVLKRRQMVLASTVAAGFLVVAFTLRAPRSYTADASFLPQTEASRLGRAATLASQFGISVPTGEAGRSPAFYADLLQSREVLSRVLTDTLEIADVRWGDTIRRSGTLVDLLEIKAESEMLRRKRAVGWLREDAVRASTVQETGLVELEITTPWANVSLWVAERLIELLNEFNLQRRQSEAVAERRFIEDRLVDARAELLEVEERLKRFLENNRSFQNSPDLVFEHDRLQRQVAMRQEIFTSLSQAYEEARISEVRNTPVLTVVENPEIPPQADSRGLAFKAVLGLMLGLVLGLGLAFISEFVLQGRQEGDADYEEFRGLWEETWTGVLRPFRGLLRKG